ncbi:3-hydroxyanthranilate 3 [Diplonema papillatum]|nr:3-hydroxyanthranilate 3 [Diplonema papillatum]|eukprot:gene19459-29988_t
MAGRFQPIPMQQWIKDNEASFVPPICNKLMYGEGTKHKVMFVGGPNTRKDYHCNAGAEMFLQIRGNMCLKVMEKGAPKDVHIKEGQVFLLPGRIPHSPNRPEEGSVGLVLERERLPTEMDCMRWYTDDSNSTVLFERWFHCSDLGKQLGPIVEEYKNSDALKTGTPEKQGEQHMEMDSTTTLPEPFNFRAWVDEKKAELEKGPVKLFDGEFQVTVYGPAGDFAGDVAKECFVWQIAGKSTLCDSSTSAFVNLDADRCLVTPRVDIIKNRTPDCLLLVSQNVNTS